VDHTPAPQEDPTVTDRLEGPRRLPLGTYPTPLEPAPRLATALGLPAESLWIKRDDLTSLGAGGNKARKLERIIATALRQGADTLITTGAPQSNHARLTAAAGARLGLPVTLVLAGDADQKPPAGNVLLDELFGARIVWAGSTGIGDRDLAMIADEVSAELAASGAHPAVIPFGGSNRDGALAYADAARELRDQLPTESTSIVALGSGGTMAGLVAELGPDHVIGVDTGALADPRTAVATLTDAVTGKTIDPNTLRLRTDQVGAGYSTITDHTAAAIRLAARTEGIVLDPTYTGRALAGLIAAARDGDLDADLRAGTPLVFWHTGGLPGLFGHRDAATLVSTRADER
jgi:L-cysteate sulfo-lyase